MQKMSDEKVLEKQQQQICLLRAYGCLVDGKLELAKNMSVLATALMEEYTKLEDEIEAITGEKREVDKTPNATFISLNKDIKGFGKVKTSLNQSLSN